MLYVIQEEAVYYLWRRGENKKDVAFPLLRKTINDEKGEISPPKVLLALFDTQSTGIEMGMTEK
jgi:hypothetical protein